MLIRYPTTAEAEAAAIRCHLPVRYDEEREELAGFPGFDGRSITLDLDLNTGKVRDWPAGRTGDLHLKVVDESSYDLLDADGNVIATRSDDYVPRCVPQECGDYFVATIKADGTVSGWRPDADKVADAFWPAE